jgi:predicted N-formylglutamate amidohydrolase
MKTKPPALLLTCEHASRALPAPHRNLGAGHARLLDSHRAWDPGALAIARALARALDAPLIAGDVTRLLVDLNRSAHNRAVIGALGRALPPESRRRLVEAWHRPHWARVRAAIARARASGRPVLHVGVHSFVPVLNGQRRAYDMGILYDPRRAGERQAAATWQRLLATGPAALRVRRNAPYRGTSDGLTTALRREWGPDAYLGLELELNQAGLADTTERRHLAGTLAESLRALLRELGAGRGALA